MGAGQSAEHIGASPEELSYVLAERFATKCFTPLELTHFKDNFFSRAAEQGGLRYWNEKILSEILGVPDGSFSDANENPLDAGPVIFRMVSYLGAFPFQNTMAPSLLTFEAMVKVAVLLTERYGKVLKRGRKDRIKLLFGSLADVGRKDIGDTSDESADKYEELPAEEGDSSAVTSHAPGFSIDEPANDDYDEDEDDDLALAALESLDAIEVFKHDHRVDRTVYETRISLGTFRRLLMLLLVIAPLKPLESVQIYTNDLSAERIEAIRKEADSIIAAFIPEEHDGGISYRAFAQTISSSLPYLFDPLTPLFEHLLFSKNLNLSQKQQAEGQEEDVTVEETSEKPEEFRVNDSKFDSSVTHVFFLPSTSASRNLFRNGVRLHPVFSTSAHGSSLTSFSHNVLTWQSASLLILQGTSEGESEEIITLGVYLPQAWKSSSSSHSTSASQASNPLPCLFQLSPKHQVLPGNPSPSVETKQNIPAAWFSTHSGIAIGCQIPPPSRSHQTHPSPHGAASLLIDVNLELAELHVAPVGHDGVFLPSGTSSPDDKPTKTRVDIYSLEIWGVVPDPEAAEAASGSSAVDAQKAKWAFEAREAERRRNINMKGGAGDSAQESARWLLETAGIIGDHGRPGGSV
ncbi:uncharacterized protein N7443_005852 [Penicillium atrosanguineum]|uniref:uncharacterized protein n=1 Tax=Penicillium atrosanguineum TaxID=1132637 RepID=UPI0023A24B0E|nr:uncharacterized protein N7443_005852 [Penicillium atrosanguineum]KAJ5300850.1 hypothetical protein N7443_005852 [Penicillium atrosanguineum]